MQLQPIERVSVADAVFAQLRAEILRDALAPGEALPSERALTELTGVNRQGVREAVKRLEQAGLVETRHGGATRVRDYARHAGLDLLPALLLRPDGTVDLVVARSILEMRASIGPDAARLSAQRAVAPVPEQLLAVVDAMDAVADDLAALSALDWRFWQLVVDSADNIAYRLAFNSLRDAATPLLDALPAVTGDELRDLAAHRALAVAIGRGHHERAESVARRLLQLGIGSITAVLAQGERS